MAICLAGDRGGASVLPYFKDDMNGEEFYGLRGREAGFGYPGKVISTIPS